MKLLFVYNADSGFMAVARDTFHKLASPGTYPCNLCRVTYPLLLMNGDWKKFVGSLPHQVLFLHRDEFYKKYPGQKDVPLPAVFKEDAPEINLLIPSDEINKAENVEELIKIVKQTLAKQN